MADVTPTHKAQGLFDVASLNFERMKDQTGLSLGLTQMVRGLKELSVGLRATYIKLEQIEALLKREGGMPR